MRPFSIWIASTLLVFAVLSGAYHFFLTEKPRRVLVVVDSSFPMQPVWRRIPQILEDICHQRYTEFALATEKNTVHSWSSRCDLGGTTAYAPRDFSRILAANNYPEVGEATEKYLITNASASLTANFSTWHIINPHP